MEKILTAAYCRVSTTKEEQDGSYELQEQYFTEMIQADPTMELVGIYGDKGKSGLSVKKRPGLQKLMEDCRSGKIKLILTKSVSRLSRNMAECAEMIRELRAIGVNVYFEKENLNSKDQKCDLVMSILSAIAEEESHSLSLHSRLAHEQYAQEGRPYGRISFGYFNAGDNRWEINWKEAPKVITAFEMAAKGKRFPEILNELNAMEKGNYEWKQRRLKYLLTNPVYKGDYYSHGTVCLTPGKQVINRGYRDRYYIEGHHEPLVSPELFDKVQEMIRRRLLRDSWKWSEQDEKFVKGAAQVAGNKD